MSRMSRTWAPRSATSPWLMQTASIQSTRARSGCRRCCSASKRFLVAGMALPSQEMESGFVGSPQVYERASRRLALLGEFLIAMELVVGVKGFQLHAPVSSQPLNNVIGSASPSLSQIMSLPRQQGIDHLVSYFC
ncbi:hypothetical protein VTK73DRAFT_273 [Phialemonium thermophilum]|uniref:Uncharacterized protein n=1 Tax=Phialemonium thermophilum TaxID=223376 RepID=A0ABR3VW31_9PEZI